MLGNGELPNSSTNRNATHTHTRLLGGELATQNSITHALPSEDSPLRICSTNLLMAKPTHAPVYNTDPVWETPEKPQQGE